MNQNKQIIKYPNYTPFRKPSTQAYNFLQQGFRIRHYIIDEEIGKGAFSTVFKAHHALTAELFAIKVISLENSNPNIISLIKTEIEISRLLNHPNIIKVFEGFKDNNYFYFVMELVKGRQLYSIIRDESRISEVRAVKILSQLLSGVRYLHQIGIAHRDIKAQNILIDEANNVKLIDFGLSKRFGRQNGLMETFCGSLPYLCPEMFKKKGYNGQLVDIWCIGVILFFMLQGKFPFGRQQDEFLEQNIKNSIWCSNYSSEEAIQTYKLIFTRQQQRATIKQLMNCRLLNKYEGRRRLKIYTSLDLQDRKEERRRFNTIENVDKQIFKKKKSLQEIQFQLKLYKNINRNLIKQLKNRKKTLPPKLYKPDNNWKFLQINKVEQLEKNIKYHTNKSIQTQYHTQKQDQLSLSTQTQMQMIKKLFAKKNKQMVNFHRQLYHLNNKLSFQEVQQQNQKNQMQKEQMRQQKTLFPSYYNKLRNLKIATDRDRAFLKDAQVYPQQRSYRTKRI